MLLSPTIVVIRTASSASCSSSGTARATPEDEDNRNAVSARDRCARFIKGFLPVGQMSKVTVLKLTAIFHLLQITLSPFGASDEEVWKLDLQVTTTSLGSSCRGRKGHP